MIRVERLSYLYPRGERAALHELSLRIEAGSFTVITGAAGAGKTTLALALVGLVPRLFGGHFFGRVSVAGMDTIETPLPRLTQTIGIVLDDPDAQLTATSVENEVAFPLENRAVPPAEMRRRIAWALEAVGLRGLEEQAPHRLSGGQKQRLAIAAALATHPRALVLDEPTSQLDPAGASALFDLLARLNRGLGMTIVLITRDAERAVRYAHRLLLLDGGRLVEEGTPQLYGDGALLRRHGLRPPPVVRLFARWQAQGCCEHLPLHREAALAALPGLRARCGLRCPPPTAPALPPGRPLLEARRLTFAYRQGPPVLRDLSFGIAEGETVLLAGANGAGKSTLVRHFLRLLAPQEGTVRVRGRPLGSFSFRALAGEVGYVAQNPDTQLFNATVEEEVAFALRHRDLAAETVRRRVSSALRMMALEPFADRHPLALPRALRARVVIAAVLALEPRLLILDEPTAAQDEAGLALVLALAERLRREGRAMIVISHHLEAVAPAAERMVVMAGGRILADGPTRRVLTDEAVLRAASLLPPTVVAVGARLCPRSGLLTVEEVAGVLG